MKTPFVRRVLSLLLFLPVLAAGTGRAASFTAEFVETKGTWSRTSTFHYQDGSYRFESMSGDRTLFMVVEGATGILRVLNPADKIYGEVRPGENLSLLINPFAAYAHFARTAQVRTEGTEPVGGIVCRKQVVHASGRVLSTGWISDAYELPLRVQSPTDGYTVELRNFKPGPQDPALFTVPAGYQLAKLTGQDDPPPSVLVADPNLRLSPPFERTMWPNSRIVLSPRAGSWIEITGTNTSQVESGLKAMASKGGQRVATPITGFVLDPGESGVLKLGAPFETADAIEVFAGKGGVALKVAVVAPSSPPATNPPPGITAPATAAIATRVKVAWQGPAEPDDSITIARPDQPPAAFAEQAPLTEGNPMKIWTPNVPGDYEVRYIARRGNRVLAKAPLQVTDAPATLEAAETVPAGALLEVKWTGPAREGDFISVASPSREPSAAAARVFVKEGNPLKIRLPADPGTMEVRYVLARGHRVLATAPLTITPVTTEVSPPASAVAGTEFEVRWQGPASPGDVIIIVRPDLNYIDGASVREGQPIKLRAPKEPGTYEVRYLSARDNRVRAKALITITAP